VRKAAFLLSVTINFFVVGDDCGGKTAGPVRSHAIRQPGYRFWVLKLSTPCERNLPGKITSDMRVTAAFAWRSVRLMRQVRSGILCHA
jgi:hypothetical protein